MKNIALIGFMGAGKTAVGRRLAEKLGRKFEFIEMDSLIEQKAGKSTPEIFRQDGETAFRELEIEITQEIARRKGVVIACGGGIILNQINVDHLKESSRIVYLTASPRVILERVSGQPGQRPLLAVDNPTLTIRELIKLRIPLYERAADIRINTSKLGINAVAEQIIDKLKNDESFDLSK